MQIHATANLILTVPRPLKEDPIDKIMLMAEQEINKRQGFVMPETKTQVGIRIHVLRGEEVKR